MPDPHPSLREGPDSPADPVAAYLAEVRERNGGPSVKFGTICAEDIPRLLAAVEAVLALHGSEGVYASVADCLHPEPAKEDPAWRDWYRDHPEGTGSAEDPRICKLTEIGRYCPECQEMTYGDDPDGEDYYPAPCGVREAISRALLGEGE